MLILGITSPVSWNPAACLLRDGELLAFVEEERLSRVKHAPNEVPLRAIRYCLSEGNVSLSDIDRIGIGFSNLGTIWQAAATDFIRRPVRRNLLTWIYPTEEILARAIHQGAWRGWPFSRDDRRLRWIRHHRAHVASAFYLSGYSEANVVSLDGWGGEEAGVLGVGRGARFDVVARVPSDRSWGVFYEQVTEVLGFRRHSDEGKVMGLAAYGAVDRQWNSLVDWSEKVPLPIPNRTRKFLSSIPARSSNQPLLDVHKNASATVQDLLERAMLQMARYLERESGLRNLCIAGGVGLNCSMNGKVVASGIADQVFVQPANSDAGTALGAAIQVFVDECGQRPGWVFEDPYLGPAYTNDEIERVLRRAKISTFELVPDICQKSAALLAQDKLVGWVQGRAEVGPRALGNRSILANPANPVMRDILNNQVKGREPWRPFAPALRQEDATEVFQGGHESPFMILAFPVQPDLAPAIPSAVHIDGTCRPQTVDRRINPRFWSLIDCFKKQTGIPVLLNTSFNLAGEPIVCSPEDALSTFYRCGLDYLVMGDYLVWK